MTGGARHRIGVPWDAPVFKLSNSQHPLPRSLIEDSSEFEFRADLAPVTAESLAAAQRNADMLRVVLRNSVAGADSRAIDDFIASRDVASQAAMSGPSDVLFLHTTPMTFGDRPWVIHVESTLPLFEPFFGHFRTWDIDLDATPAWRFVRHLLRAPACRAIFTHLRRTASDLPLLFRDEALAGKIHYAPLGLELPVEIARAADHAIDRKNAKSSDDEFTFLFTNSWHQDPDSFTKRGGLSAVLGFISLLERRPNCRLVLRSALPPRLDSELVRMICSHPRIEIIDRMLSDAELYDLVLQADGFLLPSANLHTISLLRAMGMGAVIVATDAVGVDEFVADGDNAIVIQARNGVTYREDREQGLLRERVEPLNLLDMPLAVNIGMALERLIVDRELRNGLRMRARRGLAERHRMEPWRDGFHAMLRKALSPTQAAAS